MRKNLFLTLVSFFCFLSMSNAQFGLGAGVLYGTDSELGFTGRVNYDVNSKIGVYLGFSLLDSESEEGVSASLTSIDLNAHYHFSEGTTRPYALAGVNITRASVSVLGIKVSDSTTGFNVGGGVIHNLSDKFALFGEAKYTLGDADQAVFTVGARYAF
jgi:opacity protein-like surface antigen